MIKYIAYDKFISMGTRQFRMSGDGGKGGVLLNGQRLGATLFDSEKQAQKAIEQTTAWATRQGLFSDSWQPKNYVIVPVDVSRPRRKAKSRR